MSSSIDEESLSELVEKLAGPLAGELADSMGPSLESMSPKEAVDEYFDSRELKSSTERTHESSLRNFFLRWCSEVANIEDMNHLSGSDLAAYRRWRRDEASNRVEKLSPKSEETQQKITRGFIKFCETLEVVPKRLHECVLIPTLDKDDEVRDLVLESKRANEICSYLSEYHYASREHIIWELFTSVGPRLGDVRSLDLDDFEKNSAGACLKFRHRPETGTTLKNGTEGERNVDFPLDAAEALHDYTEDIRVNPTNDGDENEREPLVTTKEGRISEGTIRSYIYAYTRPCAIGRECPVGKDINECKAARRYNWAHKCPDSLSCHPVRKGYITNALERGIPMRVISERCDVTEEVIDKHYDFRTKAQKMEARRNLLEAIDEDNSRYGE